jgi:predicted nuclease with TOPRIM domain
MSAMADDLLAVLTRFHREIVRPDIERIVGESEHRLRDEMQSHFDALYQRLDRLETEYHMLVAAVRRIEDALAARAKDREQVRAEIAGLKSRLAMLEEQIRGLEAGI